MTIVFAHGAVTVDKTTHVHRVDTRHPDADPAHEAYLIAVLKDMGKVCGGDLTTDDDPDVLLTCIARPHAGSCGLTVEPTTIGAGL